MDRDEAGRRMLFHAMLLVMIAFAIGLGLPTKPAHARAWMATHLSTLIAGGLLLAVGLVLPKLRLGDRGAKLAMWGWILGSYAGVGLNVFASVTGMPGPATQPDVQPAAWQAAVLGLCLLVIVPGFLGGGALVLYGLRGKR